MGNIIEHGENSNNQSVRVGDSEAPVSLKVYQDVYHQVTGRTEQISKRYSENLLIEFSEIEQLNHKIMQLSDVHNIVAHNEIVSIFHEKERKEQFTSFERFRAYNANATSPSVNLVLKYNFSIIPASLNRPQEYVITIRLTSRVAICNQIEEDSPPFVTARMIGYIAGNTGEITIDYADYIIARGFLEAFDEWIMSCNTTPKSAVLKRLQHWSHIIPYVGKTIAALLIIMFALQAIPELVSSVSAMPEMWARFFIIYSGGAYLVINFMGVIGRGIEESIDSYPVLSYLKLNKGDEKLIAAFEKCKERVVLKFVVSSFVVIILGIISAELDKLI
ncbi:MAG: hypothetical protein Q8Q50_13095 [Methylobacter sp.]|nr:hypothetical protein [Methylobacter sp.]